MTQCAPSSSSQACVSGRANHQQGTGRISLQAEAVEQDFPGGDRRQRQGRGLREATEEIATGRQVIRDHLQISPPSDLGRNQILGWLDAFQARWPDVSFRLQFSDCAADVYRQPVDLAIRYGSQPDSGRGIAYKSGLDIAEDIASRRLIRLCPDWQGETVPLALICADRRQLSPTVVLLREHLREQCEALGQRLETS